MRSKDEIIKEKQSKIDFSIKKLEEFYQNNDKKLDKVDEIKNRLLVN